MAVRVAHVACTDTWGGRELGACPTLSAPRPLRVSPHVQPLRHTLDVSWESLHRPGEEPRMARVKGTIWGSLETLKLKQVEAEPP